MDLEIETHGFLRNPGNLAPKGRPGRDLQLVKSGRSGKRVDEASLVVV